MFDYQHGISDGDEMKASPHHHDCISMPTSFIVLLMILVSHMSMTTNVLAEEKATMVCKGGPEITFQTEFQLELNKIVATNLTIHFRKGMGKTDSQGRNLNRGECGLLGRVFSPKHKSVISSPVKNMKLKVHDGKITAKPTSRPWIDLTLSNRNVQFPVVINKVGAIHSVEE